MITRRLAALLLILGFPFSFVTANQGYEMMPPPEEIFVQEDDNVVIVSKLNGIYLTGSEHEIRESGMSELNWVHVQHLTVPGDRANLEKELAARYLGKPLTRGTLMDIKRTIFEYYANNNRPFIDVTMPQQDITDGVLQILVTETEVGTIFIHKARWFSEKCIRDNLRVRRGSVIDCAMILEDLEWMNRNPFRRTQVVFSPGETPETTNIEFHTDDCLPLRVYAGYDNYGNIYTGQDQGFVGLNWGNMFGIGHLLAYQYTFSMDFSKLQAHTFNYNVPLPWRHNLVFYGGYSHVRVLLPNAATTPEDIKQKGFGTQLSLRYYVPVCLRCIPWLQDFFAGCDYKRTNTDLTFADTPLFGQSVNLTQVMVGYQTDFDLLGSNAQFQVSAFWSPKEWLHDQTNQDFESLRPGAHNTYAYMRSYIENTRCLGYGFSAYTFIEGQLSNQNLLPSEQYGLGGHDSVRGYAEREVNGDNALFVSFELQTPTFPIMEYLPIRLFTRACDRLMLLAFVDYGYAVNHHLLPEEKNQHLLGIGPGLRFVIDTNLVVEADWGFQMNRTDFNQGFRNRVYFSLIASW